MNICEICKRSFKSFQGLSTHLNSKHSDVSHKFYYDKYLKKDPNEGICKECGKPTKFLRISQGYNIYCCNPCPTNKEMVRFLKKGLKDKYGVDHNTQIISVKEQQIQTTFKRYGTKYSCNNKKIMKLSQQQKTKNNSKKIDIFLEKHKMILLEKYNGNQLEILNFKCLKCNNLFQNYWKYLQQFPRCPFCNPIIHGISKPEKELFEYIYSISNSKIYENVKNIITPYELDIYIPEKKMAIEFNGLYWHSEKYCDKNYHSMKSNMCKEKGIQLIHIFEDEWIHKKYKIKNRIKYILDKKIYTLYKEEYKIIENENVLKFYHKNKLISILFYNKKSSDIHIQKLYFKNYKYSFFVLSKFIDCFKHGNIFIECDYSWGNNIYYLNGFRFYKYIKPTYKYIDKLCVRRVSENKNNCLKIYDCGKIKYKLTKK